MLPGSSFPDLLDRCVIPARIRLFPLSARAILNPSPSIRSVCFSRTLLPSAAHIHRIVCCLFVQETDLRDEHALRFVRRLAVTYKARGLELPLCVLLALVRHASASLRPV